MKRQQAGFLTKLYHFWGPHLDEEEFSFYRELLKECGGKALELACGSGRLLIPFLKEGFDIEGVEPSKEMVDILKHKLKGSDIKPTIHQQKLEDLKLKGKKYNLIYISLGSLQMMSDPDEVSILLTKLKGMLEEGGKLVISLFLPWTGGAFESDKWRVVSNVLNRKTNVRKVSREKVFHDPVEQIIMGQVRFETWQGKDVLEFHQKDLNLRWYARREFHQMLKQSGFENITMQRTYNVKLPPRPSFMLFIAS